MSWRFTSSSVTASAVSQAVKSIVSGCLVSGLASSSSGILASCSSHISASCLSLNVDCHEECAHDCDYLVHFPGYLCGCLSYSARALRSCAPPSFKFSAAGPFRSGSSGIIEVALRWLIASLWPVCSDIEAARSFSIRSNFKFSSLFCCISSAINLACCAESFAGVAEGVSAGPSDDHFLKLASEYKKFCVRGRLAGVEGLGEGDGLGEGGVERVGRTSRMP